MDGGAVYGAGDALCCSDVCASDHCDDCTGDGLGQEDLCKWESVGGRKWMEGRGEKGEERKKHFIELHCFS